MEQKRKVKSIVSKILVGGISVLLADYLLTGIKVDSWLTSFLLAAVIILINLTLKPLMVILTFPITLISFGLFLLVINALVILLAAELLSGFTVDGFGWAFVFSIVLSLINGIFGNSLDSDS
ncbi:phage holin family protein [Algoriphagus aquatilis]|uniref:Phage holin family protein n=1 Tax=Algoriphagus aquatilis TaxID=490186 RepID=A0ABW0BUH8_9BACT|nr:phage holin family protein [Algoriphagus sp.]